MGANRTFRFALKVAQLIVSVLLVYHIGFPYWMVVAAAILVPIYGMYLMLRSPDQTKATNPGAMYKRIALSKSWHRVDIALCATMTAVCSVFSLIMFSFYFLVSTLSSNIVTAAACALILAILYALNGFLTTRQLQSGTIDFTNQSKLFATSSSKTSPIQNQRQMDYLGESVTNSIGISRKKRGSEKPKRSLSRRQSSPGGLGGSPESVKRKHAGHSPEPPVIPPIQEKHKLQNEAPKVSHMKQQAPSKPRVTSWFTDVGGGTTSMGPPTMESTLTSPKDELLDAREQYIKSKQYRDFMDLGPDPPKSEPPAPRRNLAPRPTVVPDANVSEFNEKFTASVPSGTKLLDNKPLLRETYKPTTASYVRRAVPANLAHDNHFESSQSSRASYWSNNTPNNSNLAAAYQERAIDVPSPVASQSTLRQTDESTQTLPVEPIMISSTRSIGVDDEPGTAMRSISQVVHSRAIAQSRQHRDPRYDEYPSHRGVITGIARPYSFVEGDEGRYEGNESSPQESGTNSTIRMDDLDRSRSPLRDTSLMTTSTIVQMNKTPTMTPRGVPMRSVSDASVALNSSIDSEVAAVTSRGVQATSGGRTDKKSGFEVYIRPRDSPSNFRPQSVSMSTEFSPEYHPQRTTSTTLRISTPPGYKSNRHNTTQL
uniref:EOG090X09V2 n=1 Tax=Panagrellus redivivus TaxID=6233 RepID=A0A7E4UL72_PANRE